MKKIVLLSFILPVNQFAAEAEQPEKEIEPLVKKALITSLKAFSLQELKQKLNPDSFEEALKVYPSLFAQKIERRQAGAAGLPFIVNEKYVIQQGPRTDNHFDLFIYNRETKKEIIQTLVLHPAYSPNTEILSFDFVGNDRLYIFTREKYYKFLYIIKINDSASHTRLTSANGFMIEDDVEAIKVIRTEPDLLIELQKPHRPNLIINVDLTRDPKAFVLPVNEQITMRDPQFFYEGGNYFIVVPKYLNFFRNLAIDFAAYNAFVDNNVLVVQTIRPIIRNFQRQVVMLHDGIISDVIDFNSYQLFVIAPPKRGYIVPIRFIAPAARAAGPIDPVHLIFSDSDQVLTFFMRGPQPPAYDYDKYIGMAIISGEFDREGAIIGRYLNIIDQNKTVHKLPLQDFQWQAIKIFHYQDQDIIVISDTTAHSLHFYSYKNGALTLLYTREIPDLMDIKRVDQQLVIVTESLIEIFDPLLWTVNKFNAADECYQQQFIEYDKIIRPNFYQQATTTESGKRIRRK